MIDHHSRDAASMTDRQIAAARDRGAIALLPVGALEQHGPHLPVDTDAVSAHRTALGAALLVPDAMSIVFPPLTYGFSPHHLSRPGTVSFSLATFQQGVREMAACLLASGFERVLLVNGHGGNSAPLRALVTEMVTEGHPISAVDYWQPARAAWEPLLKGGLRDVGHACEFETALQLHLRDPAAVAHIAEQARTLPPRLTQPYVARGETDGFGRYGAVAPPIFLSDDPGYYGDPAAATAQTGAKVFDALTSALAEFVKWFANAKLTTGRS